MNALIAQYDAMPETKARRRERERSAAVLVQNGFVYALDGDRYITRAKRGDLLPTARFAPAHLRGGPLDEVVEAWVMQSAVNEHFISPPRRDRKADRRRWQKACGVDVARMPNKAHADSMGWRWMLPGAVRAMSRHLAAERRAFIQGWADQ